MLAMLFTGVVGSQCLYDEVTLGPYGTYDAQKYYFHEPSKVEVISSGSRKRFISSEALHFLSVVISSFLCFAGRRNVSNYCFNLSSRKSSF